jgi:hypothetical protein
LRNLRDAVENFYGHVNSETLSPPLNLRLDPSLLFSRGVHCWGRFLSGTLGMTKCNHFPPPPISISAPIAPGGLFNRLYLVPTSRAVLASAVLGWEEHSRIPPFLIHRGPFDLSDIARATIVSRSHNPEPGCGTPHVSSTIEFVSSVLSWISLKLKSQLSGLPLLGYFGYPHFL